MINPVQPNTQSTIIPMDAFAGQKLDRSLETTRKVIDRKSDIPTAREEIPREEVEKATEKLNRLMGIINKRYEFSIHENSQRLTVKIVDKENGDVLSQIPSKEALALLETFNQMAGLLFDELV